MKTVLKSTVVAATAALIAAPAFAYDPSESSAVVPQREYAVEVAPQTAESGEAIEVAPERLYEPRAAEQLEGLDTEVYSFDGSETDDYTRRYR